MSLIVVDEDEWQERKAEVERLLESEKLAWAEVGAALAEGDRLRGAVAIARGYLRTVEKGVNIDDHDRALLLEGALRSLEME